MKARLKTTAASRQGLNTLEKLLQEMGALNNFVAATRDYTPALKASIKSLHKIHYQIIFNAIISLAMLAG